MKTIKMALLTIALAIGLYGCGEGTAARNTGPVINFACLQDSSKTGDKSISIDAPVTATQNCDKSSGHNVAGGEEVAE